MTAPDTRAMPYLTVPLSDYRFIAVEGPDAARFLQGQLSCDIRLLDKGRSSLGAHCTHQGRMVSSFRIARRSEGCYWLRVHAGIAERALAQLQKYIVFSKARIRLADELDGIAVLGDGTAWLQTTGWQPPAAEGETCALPDGLLIAAPGSALECWRPRTAVDHLRQQAYDSGCLAGPEAFQHYLIEQGLGEVRAETMEAFTPQLINLPATGGVSFSKGCYTGQEVVARMKYRGKLKRHMYRAGIRNGAEAPPGTALFALNHAQAVGTVVLSATGADGLALLVSLSQEARAAGPVHLGQADGPVLTFLPLPYDPEAEA